jgi:ferredoxin-type protein NapH
MKNKIVHSLIRIVFLGVFLFLVTQGKMVIWLALFGISLVGAFIFGRFYCGYMCPMNTVIIPTEWIAKNLKLQAKSVPQKMQSSIRNIKNLNKTPLVVIR